MKDLLIFTGVGDHEDHFLSWAKTPNDKFDRAINYYGKNEIRLEFLKSLNTEFQYYSPGEIWSNFCRNFDDFRDYKYYLIADSDLELSVEKIQQCLDYVSCHHIHGSTWSRTEDSYGYFTPLFLRRNINDEIYFSNWIEMCLMMLSNELVVKTIAKWKELNLHFCGGIDFVLSNVAEKNGMLPFIIFNNLLFRNVPPSEKINGREIDFATGTTVTERLSKVLKLIEDDDFFKIKTLDIITWQRSN